MAKKIFLSWLCVFIVVAVLDLLWHTFIFTGLYSKALSSVARMQNGAVSPLIPYFLLADAIVALLLTLFIPQMGGKNDSGTLAMRGGLLGLLAISHYPLVNYAVIETWSPSTIPMDAIYGVVIGIAASYIVGYFYRKTPAPQA